MHGARACLARRRCFLSGLTRAVCQLHDLEEKLKAYVASAKKLVSQGESMVLSADTCCATTVRCLADGEARS